jgi:heme/copper-type cytochrome/quinol oxidase subunit 2
MTFATGFMLFICLAFFGIMMLGVFPYHSSPKNSETEKQTQKERNNQRMQVNP